MPCARPSKSGTERPARSGSRARAVAETLLQVVVANPRSMRDLPRLAREAGLELVSGRGEVYAEIGVGSFWLNAADLFGSVVARSGLLPASAVEAWRAYQARAGAKQSFFGASNFYTYLARRPQ